MFIKIHLSKVTVISHFRTTEYGARIGGHQKHSSLGARRDGGLLGPPELVLAKFVRRVDPVINFQMLRKMISTGKGVLALVGVTILARVLGGIARLRANVAVEGIKPSKCGATNISVSIMSLFFAMLPELLICPKSFIARGTNAGQGS